MKKGELREFAAIPIVALVLGLLFVVLAAFDAGLWAWLLVGPGCIVVAALVLWGYARRHRHPPSTAAPARAARGAAREAGATEAPPVHRVLVVADDSCTTDAFRTTIVEHAAGRVVEAFVVAPALGSRVARWTGDEGAYADAQRHLDATVAALTAMGVDTRGRVGAHDPIQAADDGLREFPADEIVFATHPADTANWLERDVVDVARDRYDVPVHHVVVAPG
jgi:hypothetical protein